GRMYTLADELKDILADIKGSDLEDALMIKDSVIEKMAELRKTCDEAEKLCAKDYWPMPDYGDLMFSVD
ncbi:MAG: hypothetical protein J6Z03_04775, partial [Erysipelotrichaceae bacterium]|nr:hypothetical protein [Erysipelotrichaceae bacterium]